MPKGPYHIRIFDMQKEECFRWGKKVATSRHICRDWRMWVSESIFTFTQLLLLKSSLVPHPNLSRIGPLYEETTNVENSGVPWCSLAAPMFGLTSISGSAITWVSELVCLEFLCFPVDTFNLNQNYLCDIISSVSIAFENSLRLLIC